MSGLSDIYRAVAPEWFEPECDCGAWYDRKRLTEGQLAELDRRCSLLDICGPDAALVEPHLARSVVVGHFKDCPKFPGSESAV